MLRFSRRKNPESWGVKDIWIGDKISLVDKEGRVVNNLPAKDVRMLDVTGDIRITGSSKDGFHIAFPESVTCNWNPEAKELYCDGAKHRFKTRTSIRPEAEQ